VDTGDPVKRYYRGARRYVDQGRDEYEQFLTLVANSLSILGPEEILREARVAEKAVEDALRQTIPEDWLIYDGELFLTSTGASKLLEILGIQLAEIAPEHCEACDAKGPYRCVAVTGTARWRAGQLPVIGLCSERDQFFHTRNRGGNQVWTPVTCAGLEDMQGLSRVHVVINTVVMTLGLRSMPLNALDLGLDRKRVPRLVILQECEELGETMHPHPSGYITDEVLMTFAPSRELIRHGPFSSNVVTRKIPVA
jgi:hypothetical protein